MNQINNQQFEYGIEKQNVVYPHSVNAAHVVLDIIEGWNEIKCRICEKDKQRTKFLDHFVRHFMEQKEVPMTVQEIMDLVVPQMEK